MTRNRSHAHSRRSQQRRSNGATTGAWLAVAVGSAAVFVAAWVVFRPLGRGVEPAIDPDPLPTEVEREPERAPRVPATPGKEPDTPAPTFSVEILTATDLLYEQAAKLDVDARRKQASGDRDEFVRLLREAASELEKIDEHLDPHALWLEKAELGDWRVPSDYVVLQRRLEKYYKLRSRIFRVLPRRR